MKTLVPVDFSDFSRNAVVEAAAWAEQTGGSLELLHVIAPANWHVLDQEKLRMDLRTAVKAKLQDFVTPEVGNRVEVRAHVVEGTPHREIVRFAAGESIGQVAIATHGRSALQRFLLGSTTERVVRTVTCPVLVVRQSSDDGGKPGRGPRHFERILVATDFTEPGDHAVATAVRFAEMSGAELLLTHVVDDADYASYEVMSHNRWDEVRQACERDLLAVQSRICAGVESRMLLDEGVPSARINALAKGNKVDLVVVGPRGFEGHLLGATAERVVRGAPCSVYVAKRRAQAGE